jgi:hypothetical protein
VDTTVLQPHEYWLTDFARTMNMPIATVHKWQRMGWVHSRKVAVAGTAVPGRPDHAHTPRRRAKPHSHLWHRCAEGLRRR